MLLDSDIMVNILRGVPDAVAWMAAAGPVALPGLVVMELMQGCRSMADQRRMEARIRHFDIHWPTAADCARAYADFAAHRLGRGLGLLDALIGQTAVGLDEPLETFNVKHFSVVSGLTIVWPY